MGHVVVITAEQVIEHLVAVNQPALGALVNLNFQSGLALGGWYGDLGQDERGLGRAIRAGIFQLLAEVTMKQGRLHLGLIQGAAPPAEVRRFDFSCSFEAYLEAVQDTVKFPPLRRVTGNGW